MNIVYDNIIFELQKSGGISLYWGELIKRHLENDQVKITFLENSANVRDNIFRKELILQPAHISSKGAFFPLALKRYLNVAPVKDTAIFHSSYYRNQAKRGSKGLHIVTVHDFIYEKYVKGFRKRVHSYQKFQALKRADGIICISESTKSDLLNLYPQFQEKKIKVIYNGVSEGYKPLNRTEAASHIQKIYGLSSAFILYVGARSTSYKNFDMLVESVKANQAFNLVIVGGGDLSAAESGLLERELKNRYLHLQYIPQYDLNCLYNCAHCLVYPSSYEGFGLPLVEAQRAGCPVIASNNSSIPEIVQPHSLLTDQLTAEAISEKMESLKESAYRDEVIKKGLLHSRKFSWDTCYKDTLAFYHEVCSALQ